MKSILVLGAGRVARPCVQYLLGKGYAVTAVDLARKNLDQVLGGHPQGTGLLGDAGREAAALVATRHPDLVVCLLPPRFMGPVARICLEARVPLVHPAYLDEEQRSLSAGFEAAGVTMLPELGLDPGIDHMSAARTVRRIRNLGGRVRSFRSLCGALPAAEANTNPWGYKLSWAPESLIGASLRSAAILEGGLAVHRPDGTTYRHPELEEIEGLGWFEVYANGDSLPYREAYGIPEVRDLYRGTLRYLGWCETICAMNRLRLVSGEPEDLGGLPLRDLLARRLGCGSDQVEGAFCAALGLERHSAVFLRFAWLDFFSRRPIPTSCATPQDVVSWLFGEKLVYTPEERDLVVLRDQFLVEVPGSARLLRLRSTLVDFGEPGGDSSVARTTGLPPAIGAHLILEGRIRTPGIHTPVLPEIYEPILEELAAQGVALREEEKEV